ncbi:hypothetical protein DFP72DRAFT_1082576 [Ephemerocybe angulata]|uniref:Uncharacterized protein n=1 Tax=Ephemerocybe angulata TaxID=980116 RepID=A0A8H6LVB3_9AGAR|nr:hypothetical protein DFP72DRAFT_1082576 [Tulosesus angulatus]
MPRSKSSQQMFRRIQQTLPDVLRDQPRLRTSSRKSTVENNLDDTLLNALKPSGELILVYGCSIWRKGPLNEEADCVWEGRAMPQCVANLNDPPQERVDLAYAEWDSAPEATLHPACLAGRTPTRLDALPPYPKGGSRLSSSPYPASASSSSSPRTPSGKNFSATPVPFSLTHP